MKYKNYIFDLYGTLIDIKTDEESLYFWEGIVNIYKRYGANYKPKELKKAYKKYCLEEEKRMAKDNHIVEINVENVFARLLKEKGVNKIDKDIIGKIAVDFRVWSREDFSLYKGVHEVLSYLKDKGYHLYLLSNAQRCFTMPELVITGLYEYFDDIFISSDVGIKKPDKDYLDKLLIKHNLDKKETVLIGNDYDCDIKVANLNNIDSILINTNKYSLLEIEKYEKLFKGYKPFVINDLNKLKEI